MKSLLSKVPINRKYLLISGIPASGKTTFCRFLAKEYRFEHFDMENYPNGWPISTVKCIWDISRQEFVRCLKEQYKLSRVVIDWGFPPYLIQWVLELQLVGMQVIWFDADLAAARKEYLSRPSSDVRLFDAQIERIKKSKLPEGLEAILIKTLSAAGRFRSFEYITKKIFSC